MDKLPFSKPSPPLRKGYELKLSKGKLAPVPKKPKFKKKEEGKKSGTNYDEFFSLKFVKNIVKDDKL